WKESSEAYTAYMANGKTFYYAQKLREQNAIVKDLLANNMSLIPPGFKTDVESIIQHYEIWTAKWDELKTKLNPDPGDEFVFENGHRFPKAAAQRLEAAFDNQA